MTGASSTFSLLLPPHPHPKQGAVQPLVTHMSTADTTPSCSAPAQGHKGNVLAAWPPSQEGEEPAKPGSTMQVQRHRGNAWRSAESPEQNTEHHGPAHNNRVGTEGVSLLWAAPLQGTWPGGTLGVRPVAARPHTRV